MTTTQATLAADWRAAQPGDTLVLEGEFPALTKLAARSFDPPLTIDASKATIIAGALKGISGVRWIGGTLRPRGGVTVKSAGALVYGYGLYLDDCADFDFAGVACIGPDEMSDGYGIQVANGHNINVADSTFTRFKVGLLFGHTEVFAAQRCGFTWARADGINVGSGWHGLIEDCTFGETHVVSGEHPDAIQLYSRPDAPPTSDIIIRRNTITGAMQGVFCGNHVRNGVDDGGFDRITIEANDICVAAGNGIGLSDGRDCTIRDNRVRTLAGSTIRASINVPRCTNLTRSGNIVEAGAGKPSASDPDAVLPVEPPADPRDAQLAELAAKAQASADREAAMKARLAQIAALAVEP